MARLNAPSANACAACRRMRLLLVFTVLMGCGLALMLKYGALA